MPVSHCICLNASFESLLVVARAEDMTFEQLRARTGCASRCGMCEPYIRVMIQTGQTSFRPMNRVSINRVLAAASDPTQQGSPVLAAAPT